MGVDLKGRLRGSHARVVQGMVASGAAADPQQAVEQALLHYGEHAGLLGEAELLTELRREAAGKPLSDASITKGIRRARLAAVPRL
jgi:hypothetical protein